MGLKAPLVGHVGDGNFHLLYLIKPGDDEAMANAKVHSKQMVERAINMGGTCTGEHGVGYGKLGYLEKEHGARSLSAMQAIKAALDPHNLMNPGKVGS